MRTRTLPLPETVETSSTNTDIQKEIQEKVHERGFYLYEWISPDELRMSIKADYLAIIQGANIPLAVIVFIAGLIGLAGGVFGVILAILGVLLIFYIVVFGILIVKMIRKSYLYTRAADIVITDNHYVSGAKILEKSDFEGQKQAFRVMETIFREPLFGTSTLNEYIELKKSSLMDQFKMIASGGGRILENMRHSRESGGIVMVMMIGAVIYSIMMGSVYFAGVGIVALVARLFSWISGKILLASHQEEYTIQSLFHDIHGASVGLKAEKKRSLSLLTKAGQNAWKDNLSGNLRDSFEEVNEMARLATDKSISLRTELEKSKYKTLFNFPKYDTWIKKQVLEPIEEILDMLKSNRDTIKKTLGSLEAGAIKKPTENMWGDTGQRALEAQKTRFEMQLQSFDQMISLLESYQQKLQ